MVSFVATFSARNPFGKRAVLEGFLCKSTKFTSWVITSQSLYKDWLGKVFEAYLKYSSSIEEAFRQGSVEMVFVGGNRIFQFFDSGAFSGTCQHDFCVQLRFEIWNVQ